MEQIQKAPRINAVLFDFMGTCLDWHSIIVSVLPESIPYEKKSGFALEWRQTYFDASSERLRAGLPYEDIDITHRRTLDDMLQKHPNLEPLFTPSIKDRAIQAWHQQKAWPDVAKALQRLKHELGLEVVVHANGTTRLQLDLVRSSGLQFDMLFSSEMLGVYKPAPESFEKALRLLQLKPEECVMVACHAYDTRGAKAVGLKTVYVRRWTDDIREDQIVVKGEHDVYLEDGMTHLGDALSRLMSGSKV